MAKADWGRLWRLARPELGTLALSTGALAISSGMGLAYPQAVRAMIDALTRGDSPIGFDQAALLLLVAFAVQSVFTMLRSWGFTVAGERVVARLRTDLYAALIRQPIAFFDGARTGELTNRLASDTTVLQNAVTVNVSMALRFGAGAVGGMILLIWMSPVLAAVALAVVPVVAVAATFYGRTIRQLSNEVQDALARSTAVAEETLSGIRTVRAFDGESQEVERYGAAVDESYRLSARRALSMGIFNGVAGFAGYGALALVVWYGGRQVSQGALTLGELTAFLLYTLLVAFSLGALAGLYGDFMQALGSSERVFELLDRARGLEDQAGQQLAEVRGQVELRQVSFTYPTRPDRTVLDEVDLKLEPGRVVALVGPSGSGKSTVAALLSRFYDPGAGEIWFDGLPMRGLDPHWLRRQVGVVSQEPTLFATSIAENIRYGRRDATLEEVHQAAAAANALAFIEAFPEGFNTLVGERGVRLSGGQKQRIAIARALLHNPRLLILDEATSALDAESEHLVQEALERLMEGRTTLIIAHRLSTVRQADEVVVLDQGRVVERGPHEQLVQQQGLYRRLVERQFSVA